MKELVELIRENNWEKLLKFLENFQPEQQMKEIPSYIRDELKKVPTYLKKRTHKSGVIIHSSKHSEECMGVWYLEDGAFFFRQMDTGTGAMNIYPSRRKCYYIDTEALKAEEIIDKQTAVRHLKEFIEGCRNYARTEEANKKAFSGPSLDLLTKPHHLMTSEERGEYSRDLGWYD